jgi:hypothetical protein
MGRISQVTADLGLALAMSAGWTIVAVSNTSHVVLRNNRSLVSIVSTDAEEMVLGRESHITADLGFVFAMSAGMTVVALSNTLGIADGGTGTKEK